MRDATCSLCEYTTSGKVVCVECFERRVWTLRRQKCRMRPWVMVAFAFLVAYSTVLTAIVMRR